MMGPWRQQGQAGLPGRDLEAIDGLVDAMRGGESGEDDDR